MRNSAQTEGSLLVLQNHTDKEFIYKKSTLIKHNSPISF